MAGQQDACFVGLLDITIKTLFDVPFLFYGAVARLQDYSLDGLFVLRIITLCVLLLMIQYAVAGQLTES